MKRTALTFFAATIVLFACNNNSDGTNAAPTKDSGQKPAAADQTMAKKDAPPPAMPDTAAMRKAWVANMTPGPMHAWMAKWNGTWEAEVSIWEDPAVPPSKAKATNVQTSMLNGLHSMGHFTSTMMGMPFEGHSTMGYDNIKKVFVSTWADNLSSGVIMMTGTYDEASKTLNLKGKQTNMMTGGDSDIREAFKTIDDNTYTMTMYGPGIDGKEMKFMEGTFKRKK